MDESPRKTWLIATAAILAILMMYYYTGSWPAVWLLLAALAAFIAYQATRSRKLSSHRCVRCGAKLNPNARQCDSCGSASWTIN
jgi:ribosomal protein L40E